MIKFAKIYSAIGLLIVLTMCAKEEAASVDIETVENPMLFGIEEVVETKVSYDDQENGGRSATFEIGDQIGLYAFYNYYYYYYNEYNSFAESVLFSNDGLWVSDTNGGLSYLPLMSWTFSTVYGTAPYKIDCIAYYPFKEDYNEDYVYMVNDEDGAATLVYAYAYDRIDETTNTTTTTINSDCDFMTAHTAYREDTPAEFRTKMLGLESIPLTFTRQMASLNFQITKPDDYENEIVVTAVTVNFDAPTTFHYTVNTGEGVWDEDSMTSGYELYASTICSKGLPLAITNWGETIPEEGVAENVEHDAIADLLDVDELLFFPPGTNIWKVEFTLTDDGEEKTYIWHAHVAEIVANTHYTLAFELDPAREN